MRFVKLSVFYALIAGWGAPVFAEAPTAQHVEFGHHSKIEAARSDREKITGFYEKALGCSVVQKSDRIDIVNFANGYYLVHVYNEANLGPSEMAKSIWLEISAEDPDALKSAILSNGGKAIDHTSDNKHFLFQAPDGQVYRVVGKTEDLSASER